MGGTSGGAHRGGFFPSSLCIAGTLRPYPLFSILLYRVRLRRYNSRAAHNFCTTMKRIIRLCVFLSEPRILPHSALSRQKKGIRERSSDVFAVLELYFFSLVAFFSSFKFGSFHRRFSFLLDTFCAQSL